MLSDNKKRVTKQMIVLSTVAVSTLLWCGCRSVPGLNRFARNSEPSADVLAGTGPSATYPAPPSASATPQAIASVAGGTKAPPTATLAGSVPATGMPSIGPSSSPQTSQVAGIDVSPGYATPATNYAAANANGVYSKPASNVSAGSKRSKYTFGSKTFTPKTAPETPTALPVTNDGSSVNSSYAKSSFGMPTTTAGIASSTTPGSDSVSGTKYTSPPSASASSPSVATSVANSNNSQSGFTLPTSMPGTAVAAITPPAAATSTTTGSPTSFGMPGMDNAAAPAPAYSTANSTGSVSPSATPSTPAGSSSGYMPGSTGISNGYPGSEQDAPATSGSYYR